MAHGLDRPVTVRVTTGGRNDHGEYEETNQDSRRWATRMDKSLVDIEDAGGSRDEVTRTYRVRWYQALATAPASSVRVLDGGVTLNASNIVEVEGDRIERRRRFIDIEATAEVTN